VPFGAEGAADRAARILLGTLHDSTKDVPCPLQFENLPGKGGVLGIERANGLAASGVPVLLLGTPTTHALLPARLGIEPDPRFVPVLGLGTAPNVLLASPRLGVSSVAQLVERSRRECLTYASAGEGQTIHVCGAYFCELAGIAMTHRPYDGGSATAYADFVAGRVHVYFDSLLGCRERIAVGDAVPLAVSSARRSGALPEVPTLAECGYPGHVLDVWLGIFAANASLDTKRLAGDRAFAVRLHALSLEGGPLAGDAFALQVKDSRRAWERALASIG
jgi:tripartite-type tricarboxylate transporter receptor subunit TctC